MTSLRKSEFDLTVETLHKLTDLGLDDKLSAAVRSNKNDDAVRVWVAQLRAELIPLNASLIDTRVDRARILFDKGWGEAVKAVSFEEYLASIPEIPDHLFAYEARFPHLIVVDPRPGLKKCCELAGLRYDGNDSTLVPFDPDKAIKDSVYWIRANHGWQTRNRKPSDCRKTFAKAGDEVGLEAREGVALYVQNEGVQKLVNECRQNLDLPGSVYADYLVHVACLGSWHGEPRLVCDRGDYANPYHGSASRRDCLSLKP